MVKSALTATSCPSATCLAEGSMIASTSPLRTVAALALGLPRSLSVTLSALAIEAARTAGSNIAENTTNLKFLSFIGPPL